MKKITYITLLDPLFLYNNLSFN